MRFFPSASMSVSSQLNAIFRFCVYYSIIVFLFTRDVRHWVVAALGALATVAIQELAYSSKDNANGEAFSTERACVRPTFENPMMNFRVYDNPLRSEACKQWNVHDEASLALGEPLQDTPFQKSPDRFYTMPSTTAHGDQDGFAKWLYGNMPSKKQATTDHSPSL